MKNHKKGFTLIEMLIVIAIIAILAAILIPTATAATTKAKAAVDAANLRSVMGLANTQLLANDAEVASTIAGLAPISSSTFPGAQGYIYYIEPGFMVAYYESNGAYYTVDSFAAAAASGTAPAAATLPEGGTSYPVGSTT